MSDLSEGEVHVEAMRLILAEMERREDIPDWTIWQHMLNMLETIFQGIEDQRADDADEIETLRKELDAAKRAASDEFAERQVLTVETQQDAAAWQQQVDSANKEVSYLRARLDEERSVSAGLRQQLGAANVTILAQKAGNQYLRLLADKVRAIVSSEDIASSKCEFIAEALDDLDDGTIEPTPSPEVEHLRQQLADAQRAVSDAFAEVNSVREQLDAARAETVETRRRLNEETDRHRATNAEKVELFQKLQWANQHNVELVRERDAALAAVTLQRAGIERLQAFVGMVRAARDEHNGLDRDARLEAALAALDDEPTPVAEAEDGT